MAKYDMVDLEGFGKIASRAYLEYHVPLNDSIEKIAEEKGLNSEQIKSVVETANTSTYLELFPKADDKYLEFPVADFKKIASKTLDPVSHLSMDGDPLGDYKSPPGVETFRLPSGALSKEASFENIDDPELSDGQAAKLIYKVSAAGEMYDRYMAEQEILFDREVDKYYYMVKQAVLGGEKFADIKQAALSIQLDHTALCTLDAVFNEFKDNLEKDGATHYPYKLDLSDPEIPKYAVVETDHPLVKQADLIAKIAMDFQANLGEKTALLGGALLMGAGAVGGSVLTLAAAKALKERQDARRAAMSSSLSPSSNPQNLGIKAITY